MLPSDDQNLRSQTPTDPFAAGPVLPPKMSAVPFQSQTPSNAGSLVKEKEFLHKQDEKMIEEIGKELELEKEVKEAGVEKIGEEITLPEPVRNMGVAPSGPSQPVLPTGITIPLNQPQIKNALHKKVTEAILWLAVWCLRQLKIKKNKDENKDLTLDV